ncbi:lysylphosphatidylglycerol synthase domain-containing protein [Arenimonas composti]|uniref:Uncharacterized protein n=1 Tax=Arenimonas composti TR7-09 = DSM 18010 TaxID=1121013 RepID=A0A091B2A8_9GAMM|nr:lysylphosphatidylglycerol synthase domain-containing protein [Arenimonas composti]KFN45702.1 hypothetical protein P873_02125 [Arenimonas composti TR7-09 = DSM 18010]
MPEAAGRWRPRLRRAFWLLFALLVAGLLARLAWRTDWPAVLAAAKTLPGWKLAAAVAVAFLGHATYGLLDLVGRRLTGHDLPRLRTWLTATSSYALNLNFGGLVGGVGMRLRLYGAQGLDGGDIARITAASIAGNWGGYALLLASLPLWAGPKVLARWLGQGGAIAASATAAVLVLLAVVASARRWRGRPRGHTLALPPPRALLMLLGAALGNWLLMAVALWLCLDGRADYATVLAVLLAGAIAAAVSHVPAGLGVLDAVVVATLAGGGAGREELIAAVLLYRAAYYLAPLLPALPAAIWLSRRR